jgi:hypothetical protein
VAAFGLDFLPDNRVVLCAVKGVAPPVGRAEDVQQLGLDGIDVLEPLFQGVLVFVSRPHDGHHSSSVGFGITGLCQWRTFARSAFLLRVRAPVLDRFMSTGAPANGVNPGGEVMAVACRRNLGLDRGDCTRTVAGKGDRQHLACNDHA